MKFYLIFIVSLLIGFTACKNKPETKIAKQNQSKIEVISDLSEFVSDELSEIIDSTYSIENTFLDKKEKEPISVIPVDVEEDIVQISEENDIIPRYIKNELIKDGIISILKEL